MEKMEAPMLKFKTEKERRLMRARQAIQERFLLEHFGFVIVGNDQLDREAWGREVMRRLNHRLEKFSGRHLNMGTNALRAADIIKNGEKSRWFDARFSSYHAGSDKRGIG
ncbi:MAG: hypothetical protein WBN97_11470, partial [Parvibaculum sp.]